VETAKKKSYRFAQLNFQSREHDRDSIHDFFLINTWKYRYLREIISNYALVAATTTSTSPSANRSQKQQRPD
jgi:hypothetical protein